MVEEIQFEVLSAFHLHLSHDDPEVPSCLADIDEISTVYRNRPSIEGVIPKVECRDLTNRRCLVGSSNRPRNGWGVGIVDALELTLEDGRVNLRTKPLLLPMEGVELPPKMVEHPLGVCAAAERLVTIVLQAMGNLEQELLGKACVLDRNLLFLHNPLVVLSIWHLPRLPIRYLKELAFLPVQEG